MEIVLGTSQFDGVYGRFRATKSSNPAGLLLAARDAGFRALDTAAVYSGSERAIGASGWSGSIHTKLDPALSPEKSLARSLGRLRRHYVDVLYFHDPEVVDLKPRDLEDVRHRIPRENAVHLGVSVYSPAEALKATEHESLEVLQIPFSCVDGRWDVENLENIRATGRRIIARSVFLQGALLESPDSLPKFLAPLRASARMVREIAWSSGRSVLEILVGYVRANTAIDGMVLGAETPKQVKELGLAFAAEPLEEKELSALRACEIFDREVLDVRRWPLV